MEITSNNGGQIKKLLSDPKRSLIGLSIPMIFSLLFTMFNNIADAMWVSGLGSNALAAIGIVTPLFIIIIGIGVGISAGVNSSIARFLGANKFKDAGNSGVHGIILSIVLSIIIPWIILIFLDPLICLIGGSNVLSLAHAYGFWIILGMISVENTSNNMHADSIIISKVRSCLGVFFITINNNETNRANVINKKINTFFNDFFLFSYFVDYCRFF